MNASATTLPMAAAAMASTDPVGVISLASRPATAGPAMAAALNDRESREFARVNRAGPASPGTIAEKPALVIGSARPARAASGGAAQPGVTTMPTMAAASANWLDANAARR